MLICITAMLGVLIFTLLFFEFFCDSKNIYLLICGLAFLGSALYSLGAIYLAKKLFNYCMNAYSIINNLKVLYLFRQGTLVMLMSVAVYYFLRIKSDVLPRERDYAIIFILVIGVILGGYVAYDIQQQELLLSSEIEEQTGFYSSHILNVFICFWFLLSVVIALTVDLQNRLMLGLSIYVVSNIFSTIIMLAVDNGNPGAWYISRLMEFVFTFIFIVVLLYDVCLTNKKSTHLSTLDQMTDIYNGAHFYRELRSVLKQRNLVFQPYVPLPAPDEVSVSWEIRFQF